MKNIPVTYYRHKTLKRKCEACGKYALRGFRVLSDGDKFYCGPCFSSDRVPLPETPVTCPGCLERMKRGDA